MSVVIKKNKLKIRDASGNFKQIGDTLAEKTTQDYVKEIEAKGESVKSSIPDDYSDLSTKINEMKDRVDNVAKPTDEQVDTALKDYLSKNPVSALDATAASNNQVPTADGNGKWSWKNGVSVDNTLTTSGAAADAKATSDAIKAATHTHSNKDVLDSITGIVTKGKNDSENPNFNNTDLIAFDVFSSFVEFVNGKNKKFEEELQDLDDELIISVVKNEDSYVIDKTIKEIDEYMVNNNRNSLFVLFPDETDNTKNYIAKLYKQEFTPAKNDSSSGNFVLPKTVLYFRAWLSETELVDITITMQSADNTVIPPVTVEKKTIVPSTLPNPNKLTLSGLVTAEYDGSSDVSVEIPEPYPHVNVGSDADFAKAVCKIVTGHDFGIVHMRDTSYVVITANFERGTGIAYISNESSGFAKYFVNAMNETIELSNNAIKNPNPNKLILNGGAKAEYDGTSEVTVDIPEPIIFDVRGVSNSGGISSHLETDATYNELYTIAQSTPHIYARYQKKLYPLFKVDNLSSPNTLEFAGIDTKIVIDANNSITEEDIVHNNALRVTIIKKNSTYTVQNVTSKDFIDRFISNFVLIGLDDQDDDSHSQPIQVFQVNLTDIKMGEVSYFEYTCMNYNTIIKFTFKIGQKNIDSQPTVTVEQKPIVPAALPNPNKLTFEGAVTAEYDGSGAVTINIPEESSTVRVEKTASDTTAEIEPNKLYVFPEMASITYTLATPEDTSIANEYHFVFRSGATATELVNPSDVNVPDGFTVDKNKIYEVSILEGCMTYQSWAVS